MARSKKDDGSRNKRERKKTLKAAEMDLYEEDSPPKKKIKGPKMNHNDQVRVLE